MSTVSIKNKIKAATSIIGDGDKPKVETRRVTLKAAPFTDADDFDEKSFEVTDEQTQTLDDLSSPSEFTAPTNELEPVTTRSVYLADRDKDFRAQLFEPARDAFSPTLRSLSTIGIDKLGGMDDTKMRNVLRKVLRSIKV